MVVVVVVVIVVVAATHACATNCSLYIRQQQRQKRWQPSFLASSSVKWNEVKVVAYDKLLKG